MCLKGLIYIPEEISKLRPDGSVKITGVAAEPNLPAPRPFNSIPNNILYSSGLFE